MSEDKIVAKTFVHSTYVEDTGDGGDAVVVSELVETESGEVKPNLRVYRNPQYSFWTTKKSFQDHEFKKEFESLEKLDQRTVRYKERDREIHKALRGFNPKHINYNQRRELQTSPYIYGGYVSIEMLIALKYKQDLAKSGKLPHRPLTGFFDIERSLLPDTLGELPIMTFVGENRVFLAMKKSFMEEERDGVRVSVTEDDIWKAIDEHITPLINDLFKETKGLQKLTHKLPFTFEIFTGETEIEMIRWIFSKMHETKVSFIGVWNINFDIPEVMKVLEREGVSLEEILTDPSLLNTPFKTASYREDKRSNVAHWTLKWHWLTSCAHFQFVDSQSLYSYIRIIDGKEASYTLNDILLKHGLGGKLKISEAEDLKGLQTADWHRVMLSKYFTYYAMYGMWDVIGLQLLEWINNDFNAMRIAVDITPVRFFPNQTIKATNTLYEDWLQKGWVLGTGIDIEGLADEDLEALGGGVLDPRHLVAKGPPIFEEWPSEHTNCHFWSSDLDFSAQYPTNIITLNISKQTKIATLLRINAPHVQERYSPDEAVEVFCNYLITPNASGYNLCTEFFSLPSYSQMQNMFEQEVLQKIA